MLFITHDFGVVSSVADRVLVLDLGRAARRVRSTTCWSTPNPASLRQLLGAMPDLPVEEAPLPRAPRQ